VKAKTGKLKGNLDFTYNILRISKTYMKGSDNMGLLSWIGAIVVFFWVLGLIFSIGGGMIHLLLVIAVIVFIVDMISKKRIR